jgi:signal peptidase II
LINNSFRFGQSYPIIDNIFHLTYVRNKGAAFGLFENYTYIFIIFSVTVIIILLIFLNKKSKNIWLELSSGLIIGGAVGNLIDRVRLGFVIDYLDFKVWPVFNLADITIVVGTFIFVYIIWTNKEILN